MKRFRMSEKINMARRSNLVLFYCEVKLHLAASAQVAHVKIATTPTFRGGDRRQSVKKRRGPQDWLEDLPMTARGKYVNGWVR